MAGRNSADDFLWCNADDIKSYPEIRALLEFRAGRMIRDGDRIRADGRKGFVQVVKTDDSLLHFQWYDALTRLIEDDQIAVPGDGIFEKASQSADRVFLLRFKTDARRIFYWMQGKKRESDQPICDLINGHLNELPVPGDTVNVQNISPISALPTSNNTVTGEGSVSIAPYPADANKELGKVEVSIATNPTGESKEPGKGRLKLFARSAVKKLLGEGGASIFDYPSDESKEFHGDQTEGDSSWESSWDISEDTGESGEIKGGPAREACVESVFDGVQSLTAEEGQASDVQRGTDSEVKMDPGINPDPASISRRGIFEICFVNDIPYRRIPPAREWRRADSNVFAKDDGKPVYTLHVTMKKEAASEARHWALSVLPGGNWSEAIVYQVLGGQQSGHRCLRYNTGRIDITSFDNCSLVGSLGQLGPDDVAAVAQSIPAPPASTVGKVRANSQIWTYDVIQVFVRRGVIQKQKLDELLALMDPTGKSFIEARGG